MRIRVFPDLETRSTFPIEAGSRKQAECKEARVHCLSWIEATETQIGRRVVPRAHLWVPPMPPPLIFTPESPHWDQTTFHAYNAEFEIGWFEVFLHGRLGWPRIPDEMWSCIRIDALACGLPKNLDDLAKALDSKYKKDTEAGALVKKPGVSKPRKPTKSDPRRWFTPKDEPEMFRKIYEYCKDDVRTQYCAYLDLPRHITEADRKRNRAEENEVLYYQDSIKMNRRGLPIDIATVDRTIERVAEYKQLLNEELHSLAKRDCERLNIPTESAVSAATQVARLRKHLLDAYGIPTDSLDAETVRDLLDDDGAPERAKRMLRIRQEVSNTTVAKYQKMKSCMCNDGTVKQCLVHHGAITGRLAAKGGFQSHNLARPSPHFGEFLKGFGVHSALQALWEEPYEMLDLCHGGCIQLAKDMVRTMIKAAPHMKFLCADFGKVETVGVMWSCNETKELSRVNKGLDPYRAAAAAMYHVAYEYVTGYQRGAGKIAVLACGYQGGAAALMGMARKYGIIFTEEEAQDIVTRFRKSRPKLVRAWRAFGIAMKMAIKNPGRRVRVTGVRKAIFQVRGDWLYLELPSGRELAYPQPRYQRWAMPWGEMAPSATYMWVNKNDNWVRRALSGGNAFQHYIQGTCRDLLLYSQHEAEQEGYPIILSLHDELLSQVPDTPDYNLPFFLRLMVRKEKWAEDFPLTADGWEGYEFRK